MTEVCIIFLGSYSDRRAVSVHDNFDDAKAAALHLALTEYSKYDPIEIERFTVQTTLPATYDGGTYLGEVTKDGWEPWQPRAPRT